LKGNIELKLRIKQISIMSS